MLHPSRSHRPSNLAPEEVIQLLLRRHSDALLRPHIAIEEGAQQRRRRRRCYVGEADVDGRGHHHCLRRAISCRGGA